MKNMFKTSAIAAALLLAAGAARPVPSFTTPALPLPPPSRWGSMMMVR
ncbi:MAG: hypothetical protein V5B40_25045 [Candidatus Accumulibacter meliphilus]